MYRRPPAFRNERVSCLPNAVVEERVDAIQPEDETHANSLSESRVDLFLRFPLNQGQGGNLGDIPQTGELS